MFPDQAGLCLLYGLAFCLLTYVPFCQKPDSSRKPSLVQLLLEGSLFCGLSFLCGLSGIPASLLWLLLGYLSAGICFRTFRRSLFRNNACLRLILSLISWSTVFQLAYSIFLLSGSEQYSVPLACLTALVFSLVLSFVLNDTLSAITARASAFLNLLCLALFSGTCLIRAVNPLFSSVDSQLYYILCLSEGICVSGVCAFGLLASSADEYGRTSRIIRQHQEVIEIQMKELVRQNKISHDLLNLALSLYKRIERLDDSELQQQYKALLEALARIQSKEYCDSPLLNEVFRKLNSQFPAVPFSIQADCPIEDLHDLSWYSVLPEMTELLTRRAPENWDHHRPILIRIAQTEHSVFLMVTGSRPDSEEKIHLCKLAEKYAFSFIETEQGILAVLPVNRIL